MTLLNAAVFGVQDELQKDIVANLHGGIAVCVGYDRDLSAMLLDECPSIRIQVLESDADNVAKIREDLLEKKLFKRMTVVHWDEPFLPYADNLVNLVVVNGQESALDRKEVERVLVPGGMVVATKPRLATILRKPVPDAIDDWTHWLHSADGNPVANDTVSGPPKRIQWIASPRHNKSHDLGISMTGMVTGNGRLFYIADDGPVGVYDPDEHKLEKWMLFCRDAFNGMLLWKKPIPNWGMSAWSPDPTKAIGYGPWSINPRMVHKRLVAVDDYLLVTLGFESPVSILDARTGDEVRTLEGSEYTSEIIVSDQRAYLVIDQAAQKGGSYDQEPRNRILCVDISTGKTLWKSSADLPGIKDNRERGFTGNLSRLQTTLGDGKLYCLDRDKIIALNADTGDEAWSLVRPSVNNRRDPKDTHVINNLWDLGSMFYSDGILYYWQGDHPGSRRQNYVVHFKALSSESGELLWERECHSPIFLASLPFFYRARDMIWVEEADGLPIASPIWLVGLDPKTGETRKSYDITPIFKTGHHHRCYPNKATENYVIYSRNGLEYVDLRDGSLDINRCLRGVCQYGIMPANGLLYKPADPCACFPAARINGYYAFAGADSGERDAGREVRDMGCEMRDRLTKGSAYGQESLATRHMPLVTPSDWPMYRCDPRRSGSSATSISPDVIPAWTASLGESITAPVISGNSLFLGCQDSRRVMSLNAGTGEQQWSFYAEGRLDTPPTVHGDSLFFGTDYGYVYCLDTRGGGLRWRFNANPQYRQIVNHERIESAWPVNGSVIADKGAIYFHCGRFSFMDGGLVFYKLDAAAGEVLLQKEILHTDLSTTTGTATDLLVCDGNRIYLKNLSLEADDFALNQGQWKLFGGNRTFPVSIFGAVNGFLDDSMFDRSGWHLQGLNTLGKIMVYDESTAYWLQWKPQKDTWHNLIHKLGEHQYTLCSASRGPATKAPRGGKKGKKQQLLKWQTAVPVRVNSLVLTKNALVCAGTPSSDDPGQFLKGFEGKLGGQLQVRDPQSGELLCEHALPSSPVWDGMAAANGSLFISMKNGDVQCFSHKGRKAAQRVR